ncbi:BTB/POZ and TAZ domain-containing protein 1-like [Panicum miliaceum]|uniref:BTB/POZ and TAZ domain-containing protein 1-like n=1 Tax=Panicum miliaceum TaxID=4540 RepID=A0A3L6SLS0_PANMI|nr:BTB/POZ and TAZ domain-containing protein 1-like [Panicum miliaceum]
MEAEAVSWPAGATEERALGELELLCTAPSGATVVRREARVRLTAKDLAAIEVSDRWRFARRHDLTLELELLQLLDHADQRRVQWVLGRASWEVYRQLVEATDLLGRIFAATCSTDGKPCAMKDGGSGGTCQQGLRLLMQEGGHRRWPGDRGEERRTEASGHHDGSGWRSLPRDW